MGFIIWVIFIIWIVYAVNKNKNQGKHPGQNNSGRTVQNTRKSQQEWQTTVQNGTDYGSPSQRELKERLAKKYNRPTEPDILARARASVEPDFSNDGAAAAAYQKNTTAKSAKEQPKSTRKQDIKQQDSGLQSMQQQVLEAETEDVMKRVEELIVMGPDMKLSFSRDFVAEGMEMLGRIQG